MSQLRQFTVATPGERLDLFLAQHCTDLSRSQVQRLIEGGYVTVNGRAARSAWKPQPGQVISLTIPPPEPVEVIPQEMPLNIAYEDDDILVVDKPPGLTVHPAPGHSHSTLVNALLAYCTDLQGIGGILRPGIVHRLDKDTSGLMVVAKNQKAHATLSRQFKERSIKKGYVALVRGSLESRDGIIEAPIGRDPKNRKRMAVVDGGKEARTGYRVREYLEGFTLVQAFPETGRTHQIRVHFASIGHPVAGDAIYGPKTPGLERQFLHAHLLGFRLPGTEEYVEFISELPPDLSDFLQMLRERRNPGIALVKSVT